MTTTINPTDLLYVGPQILPYQKAIPIDMDTHGTPDNTWDSKDSAEIGHKFSIGSLVLDTHGGIMYVCLDNSENGAAWIIAGGGGVGDSNIIEVDMSIHGTPDSTWDSKDNADIGHEFTVGSLVIDSTGDHILYLCVDSTANNAVWRIVPQEEI